MSNNKHENFNHDLPIVGQMPSILKESMARVYRFCPIEKYHIARLHPEAGAKAMTVSFYAKASNGSEKIRIFVHSPLCSQAKEFKILSDQWIRCVVTVRNDISLDPLDIYISSQLAVKSHSDVAIALMQIEKGAWASSAILPDIPLPMGEVPRNAKGSTRGAESLHVKKDVHSINSESMTVFFHGKPIPRTEQILEDTFLSFLSFWSEETQTEISFGISGAHDARFVVRESDNGKYSYTETQVIGGSQEYFLGVIFDRNVLSFILNGAIIAVHEISQVASFEMYIGCSHINTKNSFNGHIFQILAYEVPLLYSHVLELYHRLCPDAPRHAYDYMSRYYKYSAISKSAQGIIDECLENEGFNYFASQLKFSVPKIYDRFPQNKHFIEDNIRDCLHDLMDGIGRRVGREEYTNVGRTDVVLDYTDTKGDISKYRIELKLWGREGYKKAPSQPLKYMTESEKVGVFIMIDRRKNPKIEDFVEIVQSNTEYPCSSVLDIPIIETDLKHFVSFHSDERYKSPRMIINFYISIPDKSNVS